MHTKFRYISVMNALVALAILVILIACKQGENAPPPEQSAPRQAPVLPAQPGQGFPSPPAMGSAPSQAAGIAWTVPAGWEVEPAREMRIATYRIHAIAGDPEDAECAVYFFGTGQGGTVEANLDRWQHQFSSTDGKPAEIGGREIAGLKVSTLAVSGAYSGAGGMMGQEEKAKPNFRMRAAIIEGPEGLVFFKLIGPLNTVAAAESDFNSLLGSMHKQ